MAIERDYGRIVAKGSLQPGDLRMLCAALHQTIIDRGFSDIVLDFSMCTYATEATMLPLMPIVAKYKQIGKDFRLVLPYDESRKRLFVNTNWAHHIDSKSYDATTYQGGHVPALRFGDDEGEDAGEILHKVMGLILAQLETDRATLKAVEWSLGEIMDNVSNHARSPVGGFVQATAYDKKNQVEFVVADGGIGIPASMKIENHTQALQEAINEGVTSDPATNAGNGLFGSYQVAHLSAGKFEIHSMYAALYTTLGENLRIHDQKIPYNGTSVRCGIGVGDPTLLDKALRFKDQLHEPPFDYVERRFEDEEGELVFNMREEAHRDFGSRRGGERVRGMIENLLRGGQSIALDFDGVGVFSSSFADEVFGRLFVEMGPRAFMTRIAIRNAVPTVEGLIDRAIMQRTRLGNGGR